MNGMYFYNIGKKRIASIIGLMNLTYNGTGRPDVQKNSTIRGLGRIIVSKRSRQKHQYADYQYFIKIIFSV